MSENLFKNEGPDRQMCIDELKRELQVRRNVYPHWVKTDRIKPELAAHRILCMQKAIVYLEGGA